MGCRVEETILHRSANIETGLKMRPRLSSKSYQLEANNWKKNSYTYYKRRGT
jgi:hypothetical protein